jgi:hypothetical protein
MVRRAGSRVPRGAGGQGPATADKGQPGTSSCAKSSAGAMRTSGRSAHERRHGDEARRGHGWTLEPATALPKRARRGAARKPDCPRHSCGWECGSRPTRSATSVRRGAVAPALELQVDGTPASARSWSRGTVGRADVSRPGRRGSTGRRGSASPRRCSFASGHHRPPGAAWSARPSASSSTSAGLVDRRCGWARAHQPYGRGALVEKRKPARAGARSRKAGGFSLRHLTGAPARAALLLLHGPSRTRLVVRRLLNRRSCPSQGRYTTAFRLRAFHGQPLVEENARASSKPFPSRDRLHVVSGAAQLRMLAELPQRSAPRPAPAWARACWWRRRTGTPSPRAALGRHGGPWQPAQGLPTPWTVGRSSWPTGSLARGPPDGDLPGLAAMDAGGETIAALQEGRGPAAGPIRRSGEFPPDACCGAGGRCGIDRFFDGPTTLVVPTAGLAGGCRRSRGGPRRARRQLRPGWEPAAGGTVRSIT